MPDLSFQVESCEPVPYAAEPMLGVRLHIRNADPGQAIHTIALRAQIQIEATRRSYTDTEQADLRDLFGEPDRWSRTLRSMLWTHTSTVISSFTGATVAEVYIPCTFDFNVAATKYFYGVSDGEIPLILLFSGTVFYPAADGALQVAPIPWDKEARYRLPVQVWRGMMDLYYPNSAWLRIHRDVFERLHRFKIARGIQTWEQALSTLLEVAEAEAVPQ